jgi:Tol biopolymer transport system component
VSRTFSAVATHGSAYRAASLLALAGLLAACSDRPTPSSPDLAPPATTGKPSGIIIVPGLIPKQIAFGAQTDAGLNVYRVNPSGTSLTQVTQGGGGMPAWSPDRTKIAYSRRIGDVFTLMITKADGSLNVTHGPGYFPRWSPDGSKIVFQRDFAGAPPQVFVMNADGTGVQQLVNHPYGSHLPSWSPDGNKIAYSASPDGGSGGQAEVWVVNANGANPHQVTNCSPQGYKCLAPDWHPTVNDNRIVYSVSPFGAQVSQVRTIRANGSDDTLIRSVSGFTPTKLPVWSPDGTRIAYLDKPPHAAEPEIYTMNANGGDVQRVTFMPTYPKQGLDW